MRRRWSCRSRYGGAGDTPGITELIRIERDGHVALVRFLRTAKHNAFNRALSDALMAALAELDAAGDVRAVVLTGSGRAFRAGADMPEAVPAMEGSAPS